jgi:predicted Zn-dependent protease
MLKKMTLILGVGLAGCVETPAPAPTPSPTKETVKPTGPQYFRTEASGLAAYKRIAAKIDPVATKICKDFHSNKSKTFCDFQFLVLKNAKQPPNAFQSVDKSGRPTITFNSNMLRAVKNDNEIGFILAHETGHQIAGHLTKTRSNATAGAILGAVLAGVVGVDPQVGVDLGARVGVLQYSKKFELEADTLATHIAHRAGYNPLIGAQSFERFGGKKSQPLNTHPGSIDRVATVRATYNKILKGDRTIRW